MKLLFLAALVALGQAVSFFTFQDDEWDLYKISHKKHYSSSIEDKFRMKIFLDNKKKVIKHNTLYEKGKVSFKLDLNHFADMLTHEFTSRMNGFNKSLTPTNGPREVGATFIEPANVQLPSHVDWRTNGAVTSVKNQGQCGSCWAFSTTGALEGQHFRKTGKLVSLSEQNLVDCSSTFGNNGCNGGMMDNAFTYVKKNHGVDTEKSYPYEGVDDTCRYRPRDVGAIDSGFVDIPREDESKLKAAVATVGPVSVAIDASQPTFQMYKEGVYYDSQCSSENLDHGVLVVGYGTEDGEDYWLVKNSWGPEWGMDGYIRIARNRNNHCGIASMASYPLV